jgi:hypothetical protein
VCPTRPQPAGRCFGALPTRIQLGVRSGGADARAAMDPAQRRRECDALARAPQSAGAPRAQRARHHGEGGAVSELHARTRTHTHTHAHAHTQHHHHSPPPTCARYERTLLHTLAHTPTHARTHAHTGASAHTHSTTSNPRVCVHHTALLPVCTTCCNVLQRSTACNATLLFPSAIVRSGTAAARSRLCTL